MPVDPSSACQRLLNAAIYDLREKVINVGADIAREVAKIYKLPPIEKDDDIMDYSTSNLIDLSYRIGILKRPEWRRIQRCYEIRRDLEHEDNEYEAVLEDCFYIFKSTIEIVLSQDPIDVLKIVDIRQVIEAPGSITATEELLQNYEHAPTLRQQEITTMLLSIARSDKQPDVVRENAVEMLRHLKSRTQTNVVIEAAKGLEEKLAGKPIDILTAKLGHACGATAYFKKAKLKDYYNELLNEFAKASSDWGEQTKVVSLFHTIGAFNYCPQEFRSKFVKHLVVFYIGEPSYGPNSGYRSVFYSNAAAPVIKRIVKYTIGLYHEVENLRNDSSIKQSLQNKSVLARFEELLDVAENTES